MRRLVTRLGAAVGLLTVLVGVFAAGEAPAAAGDDFCERNGCVRVLQVAGLIDPLLADFVEQSVVEARATPGYRAVVLQVDSDGVVLTDAEFAAFVRRLVGSGGPPEDRVEVTAWVGTGAVARGGAAEMVMALDGSTMAPGAELGDVGSQRLDARVFGDLLDGDRAVLRVGTVGPIRAKEMGAIARVSPTARDHLLGLPGFETRETKGEDGQVQTAPVSRAVFSKLGLWPQLLHTAASPAVAYLLLCVGVGLLIFEFFTAGVGVAGVVGAGCFALAGYGLGVLPTRPWALVVLTASALAFAIDTQAGVPRFWTAVGTLGWTVGSLWLYEGVSAPWLSLVVGIGGMVVSMVSGMPPMIRSRFGTPTIGREWMIGASGVAHTAIDPDGIVVVEGAQWRARTNRATPIGEGDPVRVAAIDGLLLEVEPPEGAAEDYRERRASKRSSQ